MIVTSCIDDDRNILRLESDETEVREFTNNKLNIRYSSKIEDSLELHKKVRNNIAKYDLLYLYNESTDIKE